MNGRERFLTALDGGLPDRVPLFDQLYCPDLYERLLGVRPASYDNAQAVLLAEALGLDAALAINRGYPGIAPPGAKDRWTGEWGVTYQMEDAGWPGGYGVDFVPADLAFLSRFTPPDAGAAGRFAEVEQAAELAHQRGLALVAGLRGPFAFLTWHFLGMEACLIALVTEPQVVAAALAHYRAFHLPAAERLSASGADAAFLTEDLGSTGGPLIDPDAYRKVFRPHLEEVVGILRRGGVRVILHSDGDIRAFLADLVSTGISALHPVERAAGMSLRDLKARYGSRLALLGNVDTKSVLSRGTVPEVRAEVQRCLSEGASGGAYVLCSDHSFSSRFPVGNLLAMVEAGRELERDPRPLDAERLGGPA